MALSSHEEKMIGMQRQLRQNQQDLQEYLADLGNWEDEIKAKEQALLKKSDEPENLPPVRNSLEKKKFKKKKKKKPDPQTKSKKISGFDFRAWDKYDVDKALEEVDKDEKRSSSEYETDEEWEIERKKHLANNEKNTGNSHLSAGAYEVAIECYTRGMNLDPTNALLPANRALALIKLEKYGAAEVDCTLAITLDPLYVKAYLRRAAARVGLQHLAPALEDYQRVLQLEPNNKQAKGEIERLEKELQREKEDAKPETSSLEKVHTSEVKAVYKPPEQRSKKPLRRIEIEEIGVKEDTARKEAIAKVEAKQSSAKKELEAKDNQMFEKFTVKASGDNAELSHKDRKLNDGSSVDKLQGKSDSMLTSVNDKRLLAGREDAKSKDGAAPTVVSEVKETLGNQRHDRCVQNGSVATKPSSPRENGDQISTALDREPPTTAYQFQIDFRVLQNDLPAFYAYFKRIDPGLYPKLFGKSLEASILLKIVEAFRVCCIPANEDCFHVLKSLTEVNRFSTTVMFFSSKDKQGIKEIFQYLRTRADHPKSDIDALMKKYEV